MKIRRAAAIVLAGTLTLALTACGSKDPAYLSGIDPDEYVDVCDYSNIPVSEAQPEVSDDYVESYIQYVLSSNQTTEEVTDRDDVENGDIVNIDYTGTKDGVAFDGGSATGYNLTIGSGSFIDGFEDGLIGHKVGETVKLNLTFPEDYSNADLAGQAVVFTVKINSISKQTTPELTDDFVASQNIAGVTTVDQYRNYVKDQLMQNAQETYDQDVQSQIITYLIDNSNFKKDPPTEMVSRYFDQYEQVLTQYAQQYGLDLDTYASYTGIASTEDSSSDSTEAEEASTEAAAADTEASSEETEAATEGETESAEETAEAASTETAASAETETTEAATESSTAGGSASKMNDATRKGIDDLATKQAQQLIVLGAIAKKENMSVREREYESAVATQAPSMGYSGLDDFEAGEDEEAFKEQLLEQKVLEFLQSKAKITDPSGSSTEASTEASTEEATEASAEVSAEASTEAGTEASTGAAAETSTGASTEAAQ